MKPVGNMNKKLKELSESIVCKKIEESGPSLRRENLGIAFSSATNPRSVDKTSTSLVPYMGESSDDEWYKDFVKMYICVNNIVYFMSLW